MKAYATLALAALFATNNVAAFAPIVNSQTISSTLLRAAELKPEPEGGEELTAMSSSMPGSRMKNLGAEDEEDVFKFWLSATAPGDKVKQLRMQTEREASKKANFPGFRKVGVGVNVVLEEAGMSPQSSIRFFRNVHFSLV